MSLCPQLCLLAFRALFENKRAPKRGRNANFQNSLQIPHNGVIKTPCAKNQVCKSIGVTCSTYRWFTKDKEENTRKWPKKGPQRAKNQNFEKQKIAFFLMSQGVLCQKIRFLGQKLWPVACEQTHRGFNNWEPYQGFSLSSFCLWSDMSGLIESISRVETKQKFIRIILWGLIWWSDLYHGFYGSL